MPKAGGAQNDDVRQEPLAAVLFADSFSTRMRPITSERPKVLLPLVNSPMIEYPLEWLAVNDVQKVHIICCSHADQIKAYFKSSVKWANSTMEINIITSYNCSSAGEALRLVDQQGLIRDDFILLSGDTVTNMNLKQALDAHKQRRAKDSSTIMTIVASSGMDTAQRVQMGYPDLVIAMDRNSKQLLKYNTVADDPQEVDVVDVATPFFSERDVVDLRNDLSDANIYICAPQVLVILSDNFDFSNIQRDFIPGVLSEVELGSKMFVHELHNEYAAHIANMRSYSNVSEDILMRWLHPLCPDSNLLPTFCTPQGGRSPSSMWTDYFLGRQFIYQEADVRTERTALVKEMCCIGAGTRIAQGAHVTRSIIGRNCTIGPKAQVTHCFIMAGVVIEAGAVLEDCMVCDNSYIGSEAVVSRGAVISFNCVIGAKHHVPPLMRVTLCSALSPEAKSVDETEGPTLGADVESDDEDLGMELGPPPEVLEEVAMCRAGKPTGTIQFDNEAVGEGGAGFDYFRQHGLDPTAVEELTSIALPSVAVAAQRTQLLLLQRQQAGTGGAEGVEDAAEAQMSADLEHLFKCEVQQTLLRIMQSQSPIENVVIELHSLRIAEERTFADCAKYFLSTLMDIHAPPAADVPAEFHSLFSTEIPDVSKTTGQAKLLSSFKETLHAWAPTLLKFLHDDNSQFEVLLMLEEYCGVKGVFNRPGHAGRMYSPIFSNVLSELYEVDVVVEDVFVSWEKAKLEDDADDQEFLKRAEAFLTWLKSDAEDDDGEDSDDEGDEDDDEEEDDDDDDDEDDDDDDEEEEEDDGNGDEDDDDGDDDGGNTRSGGANRVVGDEHRQYAAQAPTKRNGQGPQGGRSHGARGSGLSGHALQGSYLVPAVTGPGSAKHEAGTAQTCVFTNCLAVDSAGAAALSCVHALGSKQLRRVHDDVQRLGCTKSIWSSGRCGASTGVWVAGARDRRRASDLLRVCDVW